MEIITLAAFKEHARIAHDDEDTDIQSKVDAANAYVSQFLALPDDEQPEIPADIRQAALLIASTWFEMRESAFPGSLSDIPIEAQALLLNHRDWAF
ncbi:hypothetical protein GCM10019059_06480 [Camelimonas fluminis]|uniref:Head-tail connector protein n=1 Tax=Camelimonas fluminis TaxID=1576911 RepID=A0ABV7UGL5_9HYPH|nr:head-tail connector protein [Camelimonas fluminis]GHE49929.1 hypothetical protein GCM10019059_06480 [Camelimonas fluminis]